ncbi:MAG: LLM class flavin-dependent oxidoreductase [Chloroflexi bacterium]|nr:MAG: LLM class flavin-dependent oxidoreductase [Chloroflexota bacterium]
MHLGINLWPQNTTWRNLREHALLVERLGFDSLWVWDHFYSINGDLHRPNLEGWQLQAAYAAITERVRIGCLVSGITHRHPAVLANMATTLDNISGGRAILGIGAAWNALEHNAYGLDLGTPGERSTTCGTASARPSRSRTSSRFWGSTASRSAAIGTRSCPSPESGSSSERIPLRRSACGSASRGTTG